MDQKDLYLKQIENLKREKNELIETNKKLLEENKILVDKLINYEKDNTATHPAIDDEIESWNDENKEN
ncbi:MAG: hypothetical protein H7A23_05825 [Leptospiraceae bacterium]|nr:hypothetical protein [Leptospiraceae bacterium]MCP5494057.1 hypothetical protein [Leptospiraceae bacterium]